MNYYFKFWTRTILFREWCLFHTHQCSVTWYQWTSLPANCSKSGISEHSTSVASVPTCSKCFAIITLRISIYLQKSVKMVMTNFKHIVMHCFQFQNMAKRLNKPAFSVSFRFYTVSQGFVESELLFAFEATTVNHAVRHKWDINEI